MKIDDIPVLVNWFDNPTAVARAMGLAIELPDPDNPDVADFAVQRAWRRALSGKIEMTAAEMARSDPDWVRLKRLGGSVAVWFDLGTGIVFRCDAADIHLAASSIRELARRCGFTLSARRWPYSVVASPAIGSGRLPEGKELGPLMEGAGFRWHDHWWVLQGSARQPSRRPLRHVTGTAMINAPY
jgi:hypothetical protein